MKKVLYIIVPAVLVTLGVFLVLNRSEQTKTNQLTKRAIPAEAALSTPSSPSSDSDQLVIGRKDAPITIVEYGDFKCPKCNEFHQKAGKDIRRDWVDSGKARVIFRPFPLFGEDSGLALYASFCAAEQGKFAAYYDKTFSYMWENFLSKGDTDATVRAIFSPEKLGQLAGEAGLDATTFSTCVAGRTHADAYNSAVDKAAGDSVQGTPTLILGDQKVVGPQPYNVYKALLEIQSRS